jgi:hypothetical protein
VGAARAGERGVHDLRVVPVVPGIASCSRYAWSVVSRRASSVREATPSFG